MSEKAATGAKRARANTDGETYEEEQKELVQEIHELKKVIKILADLFIYLFISHYSHGTARLWRGQAN